MFRCIEPVSSQSDKEQRSDEDIQLAIRLEHRLRSEMHLNVRVHVFAAQVQLFGKVESWYLKQQAQELTREMVPEYRVRNELRVTDAASAVRT